MKTRFGIIGALIGGFIGFMGRPSVFLIGKLSFFTVITRGVFLRGLDQVLVPLAQQSFSVMAIGTIIGAVAGLVIGHFVGEKGQSK